MFGGPVWWQSKLQSLVAQSATESEYMVIAAAVNILRYQRGVACWFQPEVSLGPIQIFEDNQGAIALAKGDGGLKRTKHVDIRFTWYKKL